MKRTLSLLLICTTLASGQAAELGAAEQANHCEGFLCQESPTSAWMGVLAKEGASFRILPEAIRVEKTAAAKTALSIERSDRWLFALDTFEPHGSKRFLCRKPTEKPPCSKESLPTCSGFEDRADEFIHVSDTKNGFGDTMPERPVGPIEISAADRAKTIAGGAAIVAVAPFAIVGFALGAATGLVANALMPSKEKTCAPPDLRWVEFNHDTFAGHLRMALQSSALADKAVRFAAARRMEERARGISAAVRRTASEAAAPLVAEKSETQAMLWTLASAQASQPLSLPDWRMPIVALERLPLSEDDDQNLVMRLQAEIRAHYTQEKDRWIPLRDAHVDQARQQFTAEVRALMASARDSQDWLRIVKRLEVLDADATLADARRRLQLARNSEAKDRDRVRREEEAQRLREERAAAQAQARQQAQVREFRAKVSMTTATNCGPILEIKGRLAKVYAPVRDYGNEHWIPVADLFPPGWPCSFFNGNYQPPDR